MAKSGSSRLFLIMGMLALALFAAQHLPRLISTRFVFEDIPSLPGYRMLATGEVSQSIDPFVGLDGGDTMAPESSRNWVAKNTCAALFSNPVNEAADDAVPVAYFTDVQCPYCRVLSRTLSDLAHRPNPPVQLSIREFPLFGEWSEMASAASLAAARQGAHLQFHDKLMSAPLRPSKSAIDAIVADLDLDSASFWRDVESSPLRQEMARHQAAGDHFGVYGTPALVVGRTLVIGKIDPVDLDRLIEIERDGSDVDPCKDYEPS